MIRRENTQKGRGGNMTQTSNIQSIIVNLAEMGVHATLTKSRLEMLKALVPPNTDREDERQAQA